MPTYTHTIESLVPDGPDPYRWTADQNYTGTGDYDGPAEQYARRVLNRYLADVASDAELIVGEPGSAPVFPTRVMVWAGTRQGSADEALAELHAAGVYTGAAPGGVVGSFVIRVGDDSPTPVMGRVTSRVDDELVAVAWGAEQDKTDPVTSTEAIDDLYPIQGRR